MTKLEIIIDPKLILKVYQQGLEDGFLLANSNSPELSEQLNINKIDDAKEAEDI